MSWRKNGEAEICGKIIKVQEFLPSEVAELMDEARKPDYDPHVLDILIDKDIPIKGVMMATGLSEEELMAIPSSQLELLYDKVLAVNPTFAAMAARLRKITEQFRDKQLGKLSVG